MIEGNKVLCIEASIDKQVGKGQVGTIIGFARHSSYHPREAMVKFEDGQSEWFWLRDLELAQ